MVFGFVEEKARVLVRKWLPLVNITKTETWWTLSELCGDIQCLVEEGIVFVEGALADKRDWHRRDQDWNQQGTH